MAKGSLELPQRQVHLTLHRTPSPVDFRHISMSDREGAKSRSPFALFAHIHLLGCGVAASQEKATFTLVILAYPQTRTSLALGTQPGPTEPMQRQG